MSNDKVIINIIYSPQNRQPHKVYANENGEIWRSAKRDPKKINISMGWYSNPKPHPGDSIFVVEPFCVLERDYNINFVKKFKYIFTWASKAFEKDPVKKRVIEINHPCFNRLPNHKNVDNNWLGWKERSNEIVFIANNKSSKHHSELYSFRLQLADMLHKKSKYKVSWYGQIPIKRPYYRGEIKSKQEILTKVKFSVCTENSYDPIYTYNYFTEKLPEVWMAGAVPIYMGCHNINNFGFFDNSYIDLRKFTQKAGKQMRVKENALIQKIHNFNENKYDIWSQNVKNKIFKSGQLEKVTSYKKVYDKMIDTFDKESLKRK